jgi:hypothetical protein
LTGESHVVDLGHFPQQKMKKMTPEMDAATNNHTGDCAMPAAHPLIPGRSQAAETEEAFP